MRHAPLHTLSDWIDKRCTHKPSPLLQYRHWCNFPGISFCPVSKKKNESHYLINANRHTTILHSDRSSQPVPRVNPPYPTPTCVTTTAQLCSTHCKLRFSTTPHHPPYHASNYRTLTFHDRSGIEELKSIACTADHIQ